AGDVIDDAAADGAERRLQGDVDPRGRLPRAEVDADGLGLVPLGGERERVAAGCREAAESVRADVAGGERGGGTGPRAAGDGDGDVAETGALAGDPSTDGARAAHHLDDDVVACRAGTQGDGDRLAAEAVELEGEGVGAGGGQVDEFERSDDAARRGRGGPLLLARGGPDRDAAERLATAHHPAADRSRPGAEAHGVGD